ncbi:hypothetical protein [Lysobacter sp. FW306-1B-D06B]|uniref:hypothetical protein n=1 Tax=Lysobacter sp. FW306-1B-D06B TaxID=3140250 RepID=UPI003140A72D
MRSYVKAKDVHRHMRRLLAPWFVEQGWQKRPGYSCAFVRADSVFWVQPSQWGDSWSGSSMTLNLSGWNGRDLAAGRRILKGLDGDSRDAGLALEERIVSRIPEPPHDHYIHQFMSLPGAEGATFRQSFERAFAPNPGQWKPGCDTWLRYFAEDDLEEWALFMVPRLDRLISEAG